MTDLRFIELEDVGCATACDCARDSDRSGNPESRQQERFDLHSAV